MKEVTIAVCQFRIELVKKFEDFQKQVEQLLNQVPAHADYVLFPELLTFGLIGTFDGHKQFTTADFTKLDEFTDNYKELFSVYAKERNQVIIGGSHLEKRGDQFFNIAYIFKPDGTYVEHKKTHIFPAESEWETSEGDELEVFDIGPAKIGVAICYEAEIPEISRILSLKGAEIIFCPSYTFTEAGFWRVRHCAQARAIENQVYFVHCPTVGEPGAPVQRGYGKSSIISPCDLAWNANGVVAGAELNAHTVITGTVDIDELYRNRKAGAATTFNDRTRRADLYKKYNLFGEKIHQ